MSYVTRHVAGNIEAISWASGFISGRMFFKHKTICNITQNIVAPSDLSPVSWKGKYIIVKSKHSSVINVFGTRTNLGLYHFEGSATSLYHIRIFPSVLYRSETHCTLWKHCIKGSNRSWTEHSQIIIPQAGLKKCRRAACELHWHVNTTLSLRCVFL